MKRAFKHILLTLLWVLSAGMAVADSDHLPDRLSYDARISVLTCAPGTELYSIFGHSSIRVVDDAQKIDWVFNYGTFNFSEPNFTLKFASGKLDYYLLSYSMRGFIQEYRRDGRTVIEQVLRLDSAEVQTIYNLLRETEASDKRYYKYDFFFDNCASRERDILVDVLGDRIRLRGERGKKYGTYRELITPYMKTLPWTAFGIQIMLGMPADKVAGVDGAVFLPDYLYKVLANSEIVHGNSWQPIVKREYELVDSPPFPPRVPFFTPLVFAWIILVIGVVFSVFRRLMPTVQKLFDTLLFAVTGLLGLVMLLFMTVTDHQATYYNLNIFWALPFNLVMVYAIWKARPPKFAVQYGRIGALITILFMVISPWLPQAFQPAIYPLGALTAVRLLSFWWWSED